MNRTSRTFVGSTGDEGDDAGPAAVGEFGTGSTSDAWQRRHEPPDNEIPVALPVAEVLGRGDGLVVALTAVRAFSTGFQFDLSLRLSTSTAAESNVVYDLFMSTHIPGRDPHDRFLIGLEFADGRSVSNIDAWLEGVDGSVGSSSPPTMIGQGGGGGGRRFDTSYWVSPLPPVGPLRFVCTWQLRGIEETSVLLDGQGIAEAGARAEELWPWEPLQQGDSHIEQVAPALPPGWFADRARPAG